MKLKFYLYTLLIVLINIASVTLFFRIDLTENNTYTLSPASHELVAHLEEPLTIKVFLSDNMPAPYNDISRDLKDILSEYELKANKHFNYSITIVKDETHKEQAALYNINPVNIQNIEADEVKLVSAYLGMVFIHGDLTETVPAISYNDNLEYTITTIIRKLTEKTTALLGMEKKISVKMILSEELKQVSSDFVTYEDELKSMVKDLNKINFNKIEFSAVAPDRSQAETLKNKYSLSELQLQSPDGSLTPALSSVIVEKGEEFSVINILRQDIFGQHMIVSPDEMKIAVQSFVDKLVGTGTSIGYLVSHETIQLQQTQAPNPFMQQQQDPDMNYLGSIVTENYNLKQVNLEEGIDDSIKTLIIVRPKQMFSERDLYELDQFLMKGNSVMMYLDQYYQFLPGGQPSYGQETYTPLEHGLKPLLEHYGIKVETNIVMDNEGFNQRQRDPNGGIKETKVYFAPLVKPAAMNQTLPYLNTQKEIITYKMSEVRPVDYEDETVKSMLSSSPKSWAETDNISFRPENIIPKSADNRSFSLAVMKEGGFTSYFKGKEIPARKFRESSEEEATTSDIEGVEGKEERVIESSEAGKLFVMGSGEMATDNLMNNNNGNILLFKNTLDWLSGREDYTVMRNKGVIARPLKETTEKGRSFIKFFNMAGLPILVALFGLLVYLRWTARKKRIAAEFMRGE